MLTCSFARLPKSSLARMCYRCRVRVLAQIRRASNARLVFGLLMCSLLLAFAVEAKTSMYSAHPQQVHGLTSTKVWQKTAVEVLNSHAAVQIIGAVAALVLLTIFTPGVVVSRAVEAAFALNANCCSPAHFVRPPPSL